MDRPQQVPLKRARTEASQGAATTSNNSKKPARKRLTPVAVPAGGAPQPAAAAAKPSGPVFSASSNDAVSLRLLTRPEDVLDDIQASVRAKDSFHPTYTHQIFGDSQRILGYANPHAEILFAAGSMRAFVRAAWDERRQDGACDTNPAVTLSRKLAGAEPCATLEEFRQVVAAESRAGQTAFVPPGCVVCVLLLPLLLLTLLLPHKTAENRTKQTRKSATTTASACTRCTLMTSATATRTGGRGC